MNDYEQCGYCGFDHEYEQDEATRWHIDNDPEGLIYEGAISSEEYRSIVNRFLERNP